METATYHSICKRSQTPTASNLDSDQPGEVVLIINMDAARSAPLLKRIIIERRIRCFCLEIVGCYLVASNNGM